MSTNFFSKEGDYCEQTRNVDQMLSRFAEDRRKVSEMLQNDVPTLSKILWEQVLSYDSHCLLKMGKGDISHGLTNYYVCPQCKNMRRLTELPGTGQIVIECGDRAGEQLVWAEIPIHKIFMKKTTPFTGEKRLSVTASSNDRWECDPFTSGVLVQMFLQKHVQPVHIAWICRNQGYLLLENPNIGTIDRLQKNSKYLQAMDSGKSSPTPLAMANAKTPLSEDVVSGIVQQLVAAVRHFQINRVAHINPGSRAMLFTKTPVSYMMDGVHITSPVTLWIADWNGASMTVGNDRIWSSCPVAELELSQRKPFSPIDIFQNEDGSIVYRLKRSPKTKYLFWTLQSLGFPIYCSSFNLYTFLTVLLCEKAFYVTFMERHRKLWESLWVVTEDREKLERRLQDCHDTGVINRDGVLDLLTGLHLKCDAIEISWKYLS